MKLIGRVLQVVNVIVWSVVMLLLTMYNIATPLVVLAIFVPMCGVCNYLIMKDLDS